MRRIDEVIILAIICPLDYFFQDLLNKDDRCISQRSLGNKIRLLHADSNDYVVTHKRKRTALRIKSFSGNPPSRAIEWTRSPSTTTSNIPSCHGISSIDANWSRNSVISTEANPSVCGSYPHSAQ